MPFKEYASYDGLGLARLVAEGEVEPAELVEAAIERIEKHNPTLNAVIYRMDDEARAIASRERWPQHSAPLQGVPLLLKDILGDYEGVPTTSGSRFLQGTRAR